MAEVFEIQVMNRSQLPFKLIHSNFLDKQFVLKTVSCIDDWTYSNARELELNEIDALSDEKIVVIEGEFQKNKCGVFLSKEGQSYCYDFWISTSNYRHLASESIDRDNKKIYETISEMLLKNLKKNDLIYCAIGVETSIYNDDIVETIIKNSTGVVRWIVPEKEVVLLSEYEETHKKGFKIYSLYH